MRMSPEEKKELDDWVEKQYPISMKRLKLSNPFYQKGKLSIMLGILLYALHIFSKFDSLLTASIIFLIAGIVMEIVALAKYYSSLSNEN